MRDEDVLQSDYKNISEKLLIANVICFFAIPLICSIINYNIAIDSLALIGVMSILNFICHTRTAASYRTSTGLKYIICLFPYIAFATISIFALQNTLLSEVFVGDSTYLILDTESPNLLVNASESAKDVILSQLRLVGIAAIGLSIYFICDSIFIANKIAFYTLIIVFIACLFGFILEIGSGEGRIVNINRVSESSFFSFIKPSHWCLYATTAIALANLSSSQTRHRFRLQNFLLSKRFLILAMQVVLFISIYRTGQSAYIFIASIVFASATLYSCIDAFPSKRFKIKRSQFDPYANPVVATFPLLIYIAISLGLLAIAYLSAKELFASDILSYISIDNRELISQDLAPMIEARQYFGWGSSSFSEVFAFAQSSDIENALWAYPHSDLSFILLESGIVGLALLIISPIILGVRSFLKGGIILETFPLIICLSTISILAIYTSPMQSPLVQGIYAVALFTLMAWQRREN